MVAVALKQVCGMKGALGWAFLKPHPQASGVWCDLSFCLASMGFFVNPGRRGFFVFPWPQRGCSSNSSGAPQNELDGLVLVQDQRLVGRTRNLFVLALHLGQS